jgi:hypothetical protein
MLPQYVEAGLRIFEVVRTPPPIFNGCRVACCVRHAMQKIEISDQVRLKDAPELLRRAVEQIRSLEAADRVRSSSDAPRRRG